MAGSLLEGGRPQCFGREGPLLLPPAPDIVPGADGMDQYRRRTPVRNRAPKVSKNTGLVG
jgi:hypothetical protein